MEIEIIQGDITKVKADAIVNAANQTLLGGGGVDGAIHRAAGPQLKEACRVLNGCETGNAKITPGFNLAALYVIHTVGPVWNHNTSGEDQLLASCYKRSLELAAENEVKSIAFPSISTGVYRFPLARACKIAVETVVDFLHKHNLPEMVYFVMFSQSDFEQMKRTFSEVTNQ